MKKTTILLFFAVIFPSIILGEGLFIQITDERDQSGFCIHYRDYLEPLRHCIKYMSKEYPIMCCGGLDNDKPTRCDAATNFKYILLGVDFRTKIIGEAECNGKGKPHVFMFNEPGIHV